MYLGKNIRTFCVEIVILYIYALIVAVIVKNQTYTFKKRRPSTEGEHSVFSNWNFSFPLKFYLLYRVSAGTKVMYGMWSCVCRYKAIGWHFPGPYPMMWYFPCTLGQRRSYFCSILYCFPIYSLRKNIT